MATFLLFESASGYALFEGLDMDEIGQTAEAVQETITCVETAAPFSVSCCRGNNSPIIGPARARARSLDPGTRSRDGGIAARSRGPDYASVSRRACRLKPPTPRLAEASVDHFLGLLVVCGGVGGHDRVCSHVFLWKASLFASLSSL